MSKKIKDDPIRKHYKKINEKDHKKRVVRLDEGKLIGPVKHYWPNGQLMFESIFKDFGGFDRTEKWYHDDGRLDEVLTYEGGLLIDSEKY